jgi:hypothetical protein
MRPAVFVATTALAVLGLASIAPAEVAAGPVPALNYQHLDRAPVEKVGYWRRRARRCSRFGYCPPAYGYYPPPAYVPPLAYVPAPAYAYPPPVYTYPSYGPQAGVYW